MKKIDYTNIRLVAVFIAVAGLYLFSSFRNNNRFLTKSEVIFVQEKDIFIKQETVNKLLIENNTDAKSIKKVEVDLNKLEKSVNKNEMIDKSEVYITIDGELKVLVRQKTPIARIFDDNESYYIDKNGKTMPLSDIFTARVPIVSGGKYIKDKNDFYKLLKFVANDDFLNKNIIGIQVMPTGSIKMANRMYDFEIYFGKPQKIEEKFNNYKAFFQKASQDNKINTYKSINLIYTQQVVCTK